GTRPGCPGAVPRRPLASVRKARGPDHGARHPPSRGDPAVRHPRAAAVGREDRGGRSGHRGPHRCALDARLRGRLRGASRRAGAVLSADPPTRGPVMAMDLPIRYMQRTRDYYAALADTEPYRW